MLFWEIFSFIYIELGLAIVSAIFFIHIRNKYEIELYLLALIPFVLVASGIWFFKAGISTGHSSGFGSSTFVPCFVSIFIICLYRSKRKLVKVLQGFLSLCAYQFAIGFTFWIA